VSNPRSAIVVIVDLKSGTGGVKVCTEDGVLSQGANKKDFWIPSDMYEVIVLADHTDPHPFITPKLAEIRSEVIAAGSETLFGYERDSQERSVKGLSTWKGKVSATVYAEMQMHCSKSRMYKPLYLQRTLY
jgi:hypothetical protein